MKNYDVIIIGAGAAGLMCGIEAGNRERSVLIIDCAKKPGEKIRISGGGRCNFTNLHCAHDRFISANPHFCKSALSRFDQNDFIALAEKHSIQYHEKTLGQLFCDGKSQEVIDMLLNECEQAGVTLQLETEIEKIERETGFTLITNKGAFQCNSLVIASGGPSIPKMGATGFAYDVARQFDLNMIETRPALVPLTFTDDMLNMTKELSGVSVDPVVVSCGKTSFREAILFTHRGLSGPAILQISSYWEPGQEIVINLLPETDMFDIIKQARSDQPKKKLPKILSEHLPQRLAEKIAERAGHDKSSDKNIAGFSDKEIRSVADSINRWQVKPNGSEGFRTAEVTAGGIDTSELSSKTFESKKVPALYFIGECVDVTGWLGGYNFQWAWSSGWCAGQVV